jgi:hypothetical protein
MTDPARLHRLPPSDPRRAARQSNLLLGHCVAKAVHGREPIDREELIAMIAQNHSLSAGAAAAAVERSIDAGHVRALIVLARDDDPLPDLGEALDALNQATDELADARRAAEG